MPITASVEKRGGADLTALEELLDLIEPEIKGLWR